MTTAVNEQPAASAGAPPPTGEGLTFEKVWAMFQETDRAMKERDEKRAREKKEFDREMKEKNEEHTLKIQEIDRLIKEIIELQKETDRITKRNGRQMGYLHNRFGELAEHLVVPNIHKRFHEYGYFFSGIRPHGYAVGDENDKVIAEVDIMMENGNCIMAVEVKAKPHIKDIEHHIKRLKILREDRDKHGDKRKIQGAIAGAIFGNEEKQATIEAGLFVIEQSGDTVKINVPEGFVPGEW